MELYTIQIAKWRHCPSDVELIDTTMKSGAGFLAPSKEIVYGVKYQGLSEEEYTKAYYQQMRVSYSTYPDKWGELLNKEKIAIACYCGSGKFCHRYLLRDILIKISNKRNLNINYLGEIV